MKQLDRISPGRHAGHAADDERQAVRAQALIPALLARWESRAWMQAALEAEARDRLAGAVPSDELEVFIEQQIATEQTEYIVEFFWLLHATGCALPERMAAWIDRHNGLIAGLQAKLPRPGRAPPAPLDGGREVALGPQQKRKLWRLKAARFGATAKAACCARLDGTRIVLSLKDLERFMALHMDPGLCRDRLDALVGAGLLEDELHPNLRLFRSTARLEAIVATELEILRSMLTPSTDDPVV